MLHRSRCVHRRRRTYLMGRRGWGIAGIIAGAATMLFAAVVFASVIPVVAAGEAGFAAAYAVLDVGAAATSAAISTAELIMGATMAAVGGFMLAGSSGSSAASTAPANQAQCPVYSPLSPFQPSPITAQRDFSGIQYVLVSPTTGRILNPKTVLMRILQESSFSHKHHRGHMNSGSRGHTHLDTSGIRH